MNMVCSTHKSRRISIYHEYFDFKMRDHTFSYFDKMLLQLIDMPDDLLSARCALMRLKMRGAHGCGDEHVRRE